VADVHDDEEWRSRFVGRQGADIALGLATRLDHRLVPCFGAANGFGGFFPEQDAGLFGGELELGWFGGDFLELL
jgi:hypothetical protein